MATLSPSSPKNAGYIHYVTEEGVVWCQSPHAVVVTFVLSVGTCPNCKAIYERIKNNSPDSG